MPLLFDIVRFHHLMAASRNMPREEVGLLWYFYLDEHCNRAFGFKCVGNGCYACLSLAEEFENYLGEIW